MSLESFAESEPREALLPPAPPGGGAGVEVAKARSQWSMILRRFLRHRVAVASLVFLLVLGGLAIFAEQVAPYPLNPPLTGETLAAARKGPSAEHWFGTDELGRDQVTRVLFAARVSLSIGLGVAALSTLLGSAVGAVAGYFGGWIDNILMRITDLWLVVPSLAALAIVSKQFGATVPAMIVILSLFAWMSIARILRGEFLSLREKEFVEAAQASGASSARVIVRHMLPNAMSSILVSLTITVGIAILAESTLSFLGLGIQPPAVSWGNMLSQSRGTVGTPLAYLIYFPGLALFLTVLAVNFLGDGMRDALDPKTLR